MSQPVDESRMLAKSYHLFVKVDVERPAGVPEKDGTGAPMIAYQCKSCRNIFFCVSKRARESWRRSCNCHKVRPRARARVRESAAPWLHR